MTVLYQIKRKVIRIKVSIKYVFDYFFQRLYILNILNIKYEKEEEKCPSNMLVSYFKEANSWSLFSPVILRMSLETSF